MIESIKRYLIITSMTHRIVTHLVIPLAGLMFLVLMTLAAFADGDTLTHLGFAIPPAILLTVYEVALDGQIFGGCMRRGESGMDLLKCSDGGMTFYKDVLIGDQIQRVLTHLFWIAVYVAAGEMIVHAGIYRAVRVWLVVASGSYAIAQIFICIGRLLASFTQISHVVTAFTCAMTGGAAFVLIESEAAGQRITPVVCFVLLMIGLWLSRWMITKGVRAKQEEYYDR